jgi:hypothetical protein
MSIIAGIIYAIGLDKSVISINMITNKNNIAIAPTYTMIKVKAKKFNSRVNMIRAALKKIKIR